MKILKIRAFNISSLRGEIEIDFNNFLKDESIFAITGPTGAGKSTILDIITCALYARTARLKDARELMSKHTGESYCEVEFMVKDKIYKSSWYCRRSYKKADGSLQAPKMELSCNGKILETKIKNVLKKIEEITNLDFNRFSQSIMLAQGGFDAFLKADENSRSNLLEQLTGTFIYKEISKEVYNRYKTTLEELNSLKELTSYINLLDKKQIDKTLNHIKKLESKIKKLNKLQQSLNKYLLNIKKVEEIEKELDILNQKKINLQLKKKHKKLNKNKLTLAKKALNIKSSYDQVNYLNTLLKKQIDKKNNLQKTILKLSNTIILKKEELNTTQKELQKNQIEFNNNLTLLKKTRELQVKLSTLINQFNNLQKELKAIKDKKEQTLFFIKDKTNNLETTTKKLLTIKENINTLLQKEQKYNKELKNISIKIEQFNYKQLLQELNSIKDQIKSYEELEDIKKEISSFNTNISLYSKKLQKLQEELLFDKKLLNEVEEHLKTLYIQKEKELLIKKYEADRALLKKGEECFLCGSKEHPYKKANIQTDINKINNQIIQKEKKIKKLRKDLSKKEIAISKIKEYIKHISNLLKKHQQKEQTLQTILKNITKNDLELKEKEILNKLKIYEELKNNQKNILNQKENITTFLNKREELKKDIEDSVNRLKITIASKSSKIDSLANQEKELNKEIKIIKTQILKIKELRYQYIKEQDLDRFENSITTSFNNIKNRFHAIKETLSSLTTKENLFNKELIELNENINIYQDKLNSLNKKFNLYINKEFNSYNEFLKGLNEINNIKELENSIKLIEKEENNIRVQQENIYKEKNLLLAIDKNKKMRFINKLNYYESLITTYKKEIGSLEKELEINKQNLIKYKSHLEKIEQTKKRLKIISLLNDLIGSSSGDKFSKFAQGITLDWLVYLANNHLKNLNPRYQLKRKDNKSLEIEIIDLYQANTIRSVNTLSGGESFLVSLSLALALSNIASRKISIDSLFLDEGFGTLDAQSLDLALSALAALQNRGKIIGIISHIEILKERIPLQIKVIPQGNGVSTIKLSSIFG